ncbi:hypothetical protein DSO57_1036824 [Entomophthora muscae]|uniref:Uncharacterized protein n=1 Tax=Entomophthora muscae TaxID=34485 RepID=A0ACC2UJ67_9FUNG|nr:hypothetical protein DSO57_1036824 [Entomophthora muscae]
MCSANMLCHVNATKPFILATVTSDKLLLAGCMENPQLQDSNPRTLQAASPHFYRLKSETDLTLEELLRPTSIKLSMLRPCLQKDPVKTVNESADLSNNPEITESTADRETKKLSLECGPPEDDKSCGLKKIKFPCPSPANENPPLQDAIEGFQTLVDDTTWPKVSCKKTWKSQETFN